MVQIVHNTSSVSEMICHLGLESIAAHQNNMRLQMMSCISCTPAGDAWGRLAEVADHVQKSDIRSHPWIKVTWFSRWFKMTLRNSTSVASWNISREWSCEGQAKSVEARFIVGDIMVSTSSQIFLILISKKSLKRIDCVFHCVHYWESRAMIASKQAAWIMLYCPVRSPRSCHNLGRFCRLKHMTHVMAPFLEWS